MRNSGSQSLVGTERSQGVRGPIHSTTHSNLLPQMLLLSLAWITGDSREWEETGKRVSAIPELSLLSFPQLPFIDSFSLFSYL